MTDHNAIHRQEDSLVIDAHTHLGLEEFIVSKIPEEKLKLPAFQEKQEHRVDTLVSAMDRNAVSRAVSFPFPLAEIDPILANQYVLDSYRAYPARIIPFVLLGDDVDHWLKEGAMGFKQHPLLSPERFDLDQIYPCLAEARVPLIAHLSSARGVSVTKQVRHILSIAPRLKLIVAHMGRLVINTEEGVEDNLLGLQHEERVYFETSTVRSPNAIARAIDLLGEERVLFGSDNPFGSCDSSDPLRDEIAVVRRAGLTENALQLVLGKNLLTCLGIR